MLWGKRKQALRFSKGESTIKQVKMRSLPHKKDKSAALYSLEKNPSSICYTTTSKTRPEAIIRSSTPGRVVCSTHSSLLSGEQGDQETLLNISFSRTLRPSSLSWLVITHPKAHHSIFQKAPALLSAHSPTAPQWPPQISLPGFSLIIRSHKRWNFTFKQVWPSGWQGPLTPPLIA